jgi:hypothetical protein
MKIKCPLCGFENEEGSKSCKYCNEPIYKQSHSKDDPYIKETRNENQTFKPISNEEYEEEEKIKIIPHWRWLLQKFLKEDLKGWVILIGGFIIILFFSESLAIGICVKLNIENVKVIECLIWFIFIITAFIIENVTNKKQGK